MSPDSSNSDFEKIRNQLEGVHGTSAEWTLNADKLNECADLKEWLQQSSDNQQLFDRLRDFDMSLLDAMMEVPQYDATFEERLKVLVGSAELESKPGDETEADYQEFFDQADAGVHTHPLPPADPGRKGGTPRKWWMTIAGSLVTTAAVVLVMFLFKPDPLAPEVSYTAEVLCDDSLSWNPNRSGGQAWNSDLAKAPGNRLFPSHLIRLQAQSWKEIEVAGDKQAVVYNLIPEGNLAELKAYVYVFKTDRDYQLPAEFDSHATSNRKYRFWSVACQQDLVFVLVFEGDEKRLQDLIKIQQVG